MALRVRENNKIPIVLGAFQTKYAQHMSTNAPTKRVQFSWFAKAKDGKRR